MQACAVCAAHLRRRAGVHNRTDGRAAAPVVLKTNPRPADKKGNGKRRIA